MAKCRSYFFVFGKTDCKLELHGKIRHKWGKCMLEVHGTWNTENVIKKIGNSPFPCCFQEGPFPPGGQGLGCPSSDLLLSFPFVPSLKGPVSPDETLSQQRKRVASRLNFQLLITCLFLHQHPTVECCACHAISGDSEKFREFRPDVNSSREACAHCLRDYSFYCCKITPGFTCIFLASAGIPTCLWLPCQGAGFQVFQCCLAPQFFFKDTGAILIRTH